VDDDNNSPWCVDQTFNTAKMRTDTSVSTLGIVSVLLIIGLHRPEVLPYEEP
jgi:hypothetical protein